MRRNGKGDAEDASKYRKFLKQKYDSLEKMLSYDTQWENSGYN